MKQYEVLYDWPISEITRLSDSPIAESYVENLQDGSELEFIAMAEQIRGLGAELAMAKAARNHFTKWAELRVKINQFSNQFADFPLLRPRKFNLHVLLCEKIVQTGFPINSATVLNPLTYEMRDLPDPVGYESFFHENSSSNTDSLVVFSYHNAVNFDAEISNATVAPNFLYDVLSALYNVEEISASATACLKRMVPQISIEAVLAFVKLCVVARGGMVAAPIEYTNALAILDPTVFKADNSYQQWNDIISVLSEYNSRKDILLKYLTLYHVFENLMIKLPIVELERRQSGRMFSIRDFSRLYSQVEGGETKALKRLFTATLAMHAMPGQTFEQVLIVRWQNLIAAGLSSELDDALESLGLKKNRQSLRHTDIKAGAELSGYLCDMVYGVRCAIVHNKETEFHLTTITLNGPLKTLISDFLIPSMEEICFGLIGSPNNQTWYQGRELLLYA